MILFKGKIFEIKGFMINHSKSSYQLAKIRNDLKKYHCLLSCFI